MIEVIDKHRPKNADHRKLTTDSTVHALYGKDSTRIMTSTQHLDLEDRTIITACEKEEWKRAYNKAGKNEHRTEKEQTDSRVMELILAAQKNPFTLHTGVIYKAWIWLLLWAGIPESQLNTVIRKHRDTIEDVARRMWKIRMENLPPQYSNRTKRKQ